MSLRQWIDSHAVSFGTTETTVPFMVTGNAQWNAEPTIATRRVPGGNSAYVQYLGRGPESVDYDCKFASVEEFHAFKTQMGQEGTLTLAADVAALVERQPAVIGGERYDHLRNVTLMNVTSAQFSPGGSCTCTATFIRDASGEAPLPVWPGVPA